MAKAKRKNQHVEFDNFIMNKNMTGSFDIIKLVKIMTDSEKLDKVCKKVDSLSLTVDKLSSTVDKIVLTVNKLSSRVDKIEMIVDKLSSAIDKLINTVDTGFKSVNARIDNLVFKNNLIE